MTDQFAQIRDHFVAALEHDGLEAQLSYAEVHCADTPDLRLELENMLRAHHEAGDFLASQVEATEEMPSITEEPGSQIGPYKLLQKLGEGGMGVVYMAEQSEPVKRRVALKIIKPGMDSGQVIARFEAERQALAIMDHPCIAKVLDAGATESGRPYFVMELVKGVPITQYCDEQHFTCKERLELFVRVCQAVQHAHQKGVIHRDLKPTNVLVAEYDQQAVPKVIDFGVAKATSQQLTEKTMFTQYGQIVGTLEYMSPEQAKLNQLDIDTRSDVYSLGVLLYEMLVGTTPFDRQRLRSAAFDEMLRIIREEEPPKPSIRLSTIATLPAVAAHRKTEPHKLGTLVRGELDWIVMKALEKDRGRRYETANGFAADIQRYLDNEPVVACPPSAAYRFRKFARRNKAVLATAAVVLAALLLGLVGTTWQWQQAEHARADAESAQAAEEKQRKVAERQRDIAEKERRRATEESEQRRQANAKLQRAHQEISEFLLHQAFVYAMSGDETRTNKLIEQLTALDTVPSDVEVVRGLLTRNSHGDPQQALQLFREATKLDDKNVAAWSLLYGQAFALGDQATQDEAAPKVRELSPRHDNSVDYLFQGHTHGLMHGLDRGKPLLERSLELHDSGLGHLFLAGSLARRAGEYTDTEEMDLAVEHCRTGRSLTGNTAFTANTQLATFDVAVHLARLRKEPRRKIERLFDAAKEAAASLHALSVDGGGIPGAHWLCALHFNFVEQDFEKAERHYQELRREGGYHYWYVTFILQTKGAGRAAELLTDGDARKALMLALTAGGQEEARRLWEHELANQTDGNFHRFIVPLLLEDPAAAREAVLKWLEDDDSPQRRQRIPFYRTAARYLIDEKTETEMLQSVDITPYQLASAHYYIALRNLAPDMRDREKAKQHFQKCFELGYFYTNFSVTWAFGFLGQLELDPSWPQYAKVDEAQ